MTKKTDPIQTLRLNPATEASLLSHGLETLGDFQGMSQLDVLRLPNMNSRGWKKLSAALDALAD